MNISELKIGENDGAIKVKISKLNPIRTTRLGKPVRTAMVKDEAGTEIRVDFWGASCYAVKEGDDINLKRPYVKKDLWQEKEYLQIQVSEYPGHVKILNREVEGY